jgi:bifunctional oligoribonuclease and PAP phosphatase NrnA
MNMIMNQIEQALALHSKIIIHRHVNPDPDAIGSQAGLAQIVRASYPAKEVYMVGEEVDGLTFMAAMDTIDDSVYKDALVIVCDTASTDRISDDRFGSGAMVVKIDHHPNDRPYGDICWVDTSYSSTSEMIADLLSHSSFLKTDDRGASLLYAGIVGDTGRFLYDSTRARTHQLTSNLLRHSFEPKRFHDAFNQVSFETAKLKEYILQQFERTDNGVAHMTLSKELLDEFGVKAVDGANLVNTLSGIEGNHIWVFFVEYPDGMRTRIRSNAVPINEVAKMFDGGGHPLASGANPKTESERTALLTELDNLLK